MTWSVYQHWDPLKVCVVGRSYPPEFYSWIKIPHVRDLFEKIAMETEEDYQNIIKTLEKFQVRVFRPDLPNGLGIGKKIVKPPMTPRDHFIMIDQKLYSNEGYSKEKIAHFYQDVKDPSWPPCRSMEEFHQLPQWIQDECNLVFDMQFWLSWKKRQDLGCYTKILDSVQKQGNVIVEGLDPKINGAMVSRIGRDLYFGTDFYGQNDKDFLKKIQTEFPTHRNHSVDTGGHSDSTYCPVCPGLIISLCDVPTYADTFPGWEVVYLPGQSWEAVKSFLDLKRKNEGKWWIPGFEYDQSVTDVVESWLAHWTGYVEETVFDVNMLIIDPKNVMVFNYNKQVFDALDRYGITPHVVHFRHRYFWDGGIHCITLDLHRDGTMQDYFPQRG